MGRLSVKDIYDSYIESINNNKQQLRYTGKEEWLHSSSAGLCARKHAFSIDTDLEKVEGHSADTLRLFRLGDIVHTDIQDACRQWAEEQGKPIYIEKELYLPEFKVRGFIDLAIVDDGCLYDIKTCNSWKFKNLDKDGASGNYAMQLGTYGYWYQKTHDQPLRELGLIYYNKDRSVIKEIYLDIDITLQAVKDYWLRVIEYLDQGILPPIERGIAPVYDWECNPKYCQYYNVCGGGIKGMKI